MCAKQVNSSVASTGWVNGLASMASTNASLRLAKYPSAAALCCSIDLACASSRTSISPSSGPGSAAPDDRPLVGDAAGELVGGGERRQRLTDRQPAVLDLPD